VIFHHDPRGYLAASAEYGPIGKAVMELSNLEFAHDQFVVSVNEKDSAFAARIAKDFPRQFRDKTDFLLVVLQEWRQLREIPIFSDGTLNLQWLQYQLDELYDVRAALAHGSLSLVERGDGWARWRLDRWVMIKERGTWTVASTTVGSGFLANVVATARALRRYLLNLVGAIEGTFKWEDAYKADIEIRANRESLRELVDLGAFAAPDWLNALIGKNDAKI
jgi:hypothetical protein